ncbi:MAG: SDR family oxidoreductase [Gemmatimonadetes bacterium]|nr:SDR family oxidoreductase [Gemmatimonadota bacterium]MYB62809.1 SDR family oxidoreductase [Gemmatimonadota bacterium]
MNPRKPRLDGKVAVVTGAGTQSDVAGTGQATAVLLAQEGAKVLLTDRSAENAGKTLAVIEEEGGTASVFAGDVTRSADCRAMTETAVERYGGLHILFNNVGLSYPGTVVDVQEEHWDEIMAVNLKAMMLASRFAIPAMMDAGGGSIINMASVDGFRSGWSYNVAYETSKGGVIALTINMAVQHGRDGIRVNCIAPGHLHGSFTAGLSDAHRELRRRSTPLGTEGTAWDVAHAAVFLAGDESRWITGITLPVDAGSSIALPLSVLPRDEGGILPDAESARF